MSGVPDNISEEGAGGGEDELVGLDGAVIVTGQGDVGHLLVLHQLSVEDNMILGKIRVLQNQTLRFLRHVWIVDISDEIFELTITTTLANLISSNEPMCNFSVSVLCDPPSPQDRYSAARSCVPWSLVIGLTSVWGELSIRDTTLTR